MGQRRRALPEPTAAAGSGIVRRWWIGLAMAFSLVLGPGVPPVRRREPGVRVAAVLMVGEPTPWLPARIDRGRRLRE